MSLIVKQFILIILIYSKVIEIILLILFVNIKLTFQMSKISNW